MKNYLFIVALLVLQSMFIEIKAQVMHCPSLVADNQDAGNIKNTVPLINNSTITDGKYIPAKDTLRVPIIYVRFEDDTDQLSYWSTVPTDGSVHEVENWMAASIDSTANELSDNYFNLTNYFRTMSHDSLIVLGDAYHIKIPPLSTYTGNEKEVLEKANRYAIQTLDSIIDLSIYDNWNINIQSHSKSPDGILDYVFMVYRAADGLYFTDDGDYYSGIASLGAGNLITLQSGIQVDMGSFDSGSTTHLHKSREFAFEILVHEFGHHLFGGNHPYADNSSSIAQNGRSAGYWGIFAGNWGTPTMNAYEKELLDWIDVTTITGSSPIALADFVSTGDVAKYEVSSDEYFYFENHTRTHSTTGIKSSYDNPNLNSSDNGVFVLKVKEPYLSGSSYSLSSVVSDGNWDWSYTWAYTCNDSGEPAFKKEEPNIFGTSFKDPVMEVDHPDTNYSYVQNLFVKSSNPANCKKFFLGYDSSDMSGFILNKVSTISKVTNPSFLKSDGTLADLRMSIVDEQSGTVTLRFDEPTDHYEITEDTHLGGMVFLNDKSLNIDNGATVTVNAGTKFFLNENKKIIVRPGAKLIVNGTQQDPVHFKRLDSTKAWGSIVIHGYNSAFNWAVFDGGTRNVDVMAPETKFNNCVFKNADRPISTYFNQSNQPGKSSFSLTNCRVENGTGLGGIVTYYADADLIDVTSQNNDDDGLWSYNGDVSMRFSVFENNGSRGIYARNGIIGSYFGDQITLNNRISDNSIGEISLGSNAVLQFGYVDQYEMLGGYNSIIKNGSNYHIYNAANSTPAEAELTYWGTSNPVFYGPVNDNSHLSQDPTQNSGSSNLPQGMRGEGELLNGQKKGTGDGAKGNPVIAYLRELSSAKTTPTASDLALIRRYQKYLEREQKTDEQLLPLHATLAQEFKGLSRSSDSKQAEAYLAYQLQREIDQHGRITQYNTLQRARTVLGDERFDQTFSSYELDYYLAHEKFTEFENVLAQATEKKALSPEEIRFYNEQLSIGKEVAAEFRSSDESSNPSKSSGQETQTVAENSLEVKAYPNPFNPTAKLSIPLSEQSDVSVEVYSVLGQRVMSYQRTGLSSGTHAVSVNGAQLASGIYIARVRVESQSGVQTRDVRLTLIK